MSNHAVIKGKKKLVKGVVDLSTQEFLPYPLPVRRLGSREDTAMNVEISIRKDDKSAWANGGGATPLAVEFKVEFFMADSDSEFSRYLLKRAAELNVDPSDLPLKAGDETQDELDAMDQALDAIHDVMLLTVLRWSNLQEATAPTQLRVPDRVFVGTDFWNADEHGYVLTEVAVVDSYARKFLRRRLHGDDLKAFNAYCRLWDDQHRPLELPARTMFRSASGTR